MNIFVYSDESGVFDKVHNDYFVFGGLIFLSKEEKDICSRKYNKAEKDIRKIYNYDKSQELKASFLSNKDKSKLYRSLNQCFKFCVVIKQKRVYDSICNNKKTKQRFLDFTYKLAVKNAFQQLISRQVIIPQDIKNIYFFVDEHSTATNGRYELHENLEEEFKYGTHNFETGVYYPSIFPDLDSLIVKFCDSKTISLVRAADIVANKIYYLSRTNKLIPNDKLFIKYWP